MTSNQIAYLNSIETRRANEARERETKRANDMSAQVQQEANQIKWGQLTETQKYNALTAALEQTRAAETERHNLAVEQENTRHNTAGEAATVSSLTETQRHNKLTESLGLADVNTRSAAQRESRRHNVAQEEAKLREVSQDLKDMQRNWEHLDVQDAVSAADAVRKTVDWLLNYMGKLAL
jgi:hypothetical protein